MFRRSTRADHCDVSTERRRTMEAQQTRIDPEPLTVRCCSRRSLGGRSGDTINSGVRPHIDAATAIEPIPQVQPADTDRASCESELSPCQTR